jgi:S1-C subfamily serine protease
VNLPVNLVDVAVVVLVIGAAIIGWRSGAIPQVLGLVGAGLGVVIVVLAAPAAVDALGHLEPALRAFLALGGAFIVVAVAEAIGSTVGGAIRDRVRPGIVGRFDQALGSVFAVGQALVLAWLIGGLLATGPLPSIAKEAQRSLAIRTLLDALPPPAEVGAELGSLLNASGLPQVFSGLEPTPAAPVDTPTSKEAAAIARAARDSVVQVDATACGRGFTGTAFSIAPGYFVTNGHVVAGASRVTLAQDGEKPVAATVVSFDPKLDVAVLRAPTLRLPALVFARRAPQRGTRGAALGHPNGGGLTVIPGAVSAEVRARGRDLSGTAEVIRNVLELRASVDPGDSGGPFILADGTVGALVFAESRTDEAVGYGLDPTDVATAVGPAIGRTDAVDPGACLR